MELKDKSLSKVTLKFLTVALEAKVMPSRVTMRFSCYSLSFTLLLGGQTGFYVASLTDFRVSKINRAGCHQRGNDTVLHVSSCTKKVCVE